MKIQPKSPVSLIYFLAVAIVLMTISPALTFSEEMSPEEWLDFSNAVAAMFDQHSEMVTAGEAAPIKCATPILHALLSSRPKGVESKTLYVEREDTMSFTYGTAHFLLHYTSTGANRVYQFDSQDILPGTPNYIFNAGRILDSVWEHTVAGLGFRTPVSDGYYNGGGDGRLDVYFIDFPAYGVTVSDSIQPTLPITTTTYMFLENDYEGFPGYELNRLNALRVSAAHEFFHSVQFAIDAGEMEGSFPGFNPAWIEMSATFMEEENYDEINDYYNYLIFFYDVPQWSVRTGTVLSSPSINLWRNLHMYGAVVFPIFLSDRFGPGIIRDIWERCGNVAGPNWWLATDEAIQSSSAGARDLQSEFQEFALWNLFTRQRARTGEFFLEGAHYDSVNLAARVTTYPAAIAPLDSVLPDNLGANYIMLENVASAPQGLAVSVNADPAHPWGITVVGLHNNVSLPVFIEHIRYDTLVSAIPIPDAADFDRIALIVSVLGGDGLQANYSLSIDFLSDVDNGSDKPNPLVYNLSQNSPNPFNPSTVIRYSIPRYGHVRINVVNLLGQRIRTLVDGPMAAGKHTVSWDGKDSRGNQVPSAVYFYTIEAGGYRESKTMLLLR